MRFFTKKNIQQGTASIKGKAFHYFFSDDSFDFVPIEDLSKAPDWKPMRRSELKGLLIECEPFAQQNTRVEIVGNHDGYLSCDNNLKCTYDKLFIHKLPYRIDAIGFHGPFINQIVQNITVRRKLTNWKDPHSLSLMKTFIIFGKKYDLTTVTEIAGEDDEDIKFKSTVYAHFESPLTKEEAFSFYLAFIRLVQFMSHRKDIYFDCDTYEISGDSAVQSGSIYLSNISEKRAGKTSTLAISLETIFPIVGDLLSFIHEGNIVPLFIPSEKTVTFSDSYILATAWAQMVFKQAYVPIDNTYKIKGHDVLDASTDKRISLQEQLSIMITDAFPFVSDFVSIAFPFMFSKIDLEEYTSKTLPERLKNVRNAIAHGSSDPKDYEYTQYDMVLLLCSVYCGILSKKFGLDEANVKLALTELFINENEAFAQWKHIHPDD